MRIYAYLGAKLISRICRSVAPQRVGKVAYFQGNNSCFCANPRPEQVILRACEKNAKKKTCGCWGCSRRGKKLAQGLQEGVSECCEPAAVPGKAAIQTQRKMKGEERYGC
ncbi:hypothetical protein AAAT94_16125 [Intestinimonas aquisgranensis]|nr:hypothetical protein [Intestinimonas aquisgranensis]